MEIILIILTICLIAFMFFAVLTVLALAKGNLSISVVMKQEFSESDRQLLEDIYNKDGDLKSKDDDIMEAFDTVIKNINDVMLDKEESDE